MADPTKYRVTVKRPFKVGEVFFIPAEKTGPKAGYPRYEVPPEVYAGTADDGTAFADLCATADPVYPIT